MKRFNFKGLLIVEVILGLAMMVGVENGFSVTVDNPMTSDLDGGNYKIFNLSDVISKGPYVDVRAYPSFLDALIAIGTSNKTLLISEPQSITSDGIVVNSNITLAFLKGGSLDIAATKTTYIYGAIEAGPYQIFSGSGTIVIGDLCKEVWANWWGLDTGASATANDSALSNAVDNNRTVNIAAGTYNITHLGLATGSNLSNCEIVGKGAVTLQKSVITTDTDVITFGKYGNYTASHVSLRHISISATVAVNYGVRMVLAADCSFYNVSIGGDPNITTGIYLENSKDNVFYNTTISPANAVECYFLSPNVNNNTFWGGRWSGAGSRTGIGIQLTGRSNLVEGVDMSNFNIAVMVTGNGAAIMARGCAVNNCYFENNTTDIKIDGGGTVCKGLSIQGNNFMASGPTANSIVHDVNFTAYNVVIIGNHFENYNTAITLNPNGVYSNGWVIMGNAFNNCTNRVTGIGQYTLSSTSNMNLNGELKWTGENRDVFVLNDTSLTLLNDLKVGGTGDIAALKKHLTATATWDPPSLSNGSSTQILLTVNGAVAGDVASASHTQTGTAKINISAYVTAANQVAVVIHNISGSTLNIPSGTVRADVWQY